MYESDEDGADRRGRGDKFAREREYGGDRRREDDRRGGGGGGYRGGGADYTNGNKRYSSGRRDDHSAKRSRLDINDGYEPTLKAEDPANTSSPVMLTFKKFLATQDDSITDEEAIAKYNEYKLSFKRQLLQKFFDTHKEEEWFRLKYHPEESGKRKEEQAANIKKRFEVFNDLRDKHFFKDVSLDLAEAKKIIFILDAVAVKLEGGTDEDIEVLRKQKVEDDSLKEIEKGVKDEKEEEKEEAANGGEVKEEGADEANGEVTKKKKMLLHKTCSVFLRNVEPTISVSEVEAVCMRSPGFLRVCLSEAVPERKWARRGWATYKRDVNIKEITWNINSVRIRDTDLHAIINKDLTRKIRTVNGVTGHISVAQSDLRLAVKLAALCDLRAGLFNDAPEEERERDVQLGVDLVDSSTNPIITEAAQLIGQDISPEEEELLRMAGGDAAARPSGEMADNEKAAFERNEELLKALDLVVFYLRIVHSVDFYTHGEYLNEDHMPNRCGIMHVRATPPPPSQFETDDQGRTVLTGKFVNDFIKTFKTAIQKLTHRDYLSEDDLKKLGKKDPEEEMEAFILANTVELSKEKWLCPLSGKKFKGPEFIRKHLLSKHMERLEQAKQEAHFYNNFLADPSRPADPEEKAPPATSHDDRERNTSSNYNRGNDRPRYSGGSGGGGGGPRGYGGGGYGGPRDEPPRNRPMPPRYYDAPPPADGGGRRDPRQPMSYRDLDAPEEIF